MTGPSSERTADADIVREAMCCDEHRSEDCPCLQWAPEAHAALDRLVARNQQLQEALADLVSWQPHLERVLAQLHPQHRDAVLAARAALASVRARTP